MRAVETDDQAGDEHELKAPPAPALDPFPEAREPLAQQQAILSHSL